MNSIQQEDIKDFATSFELSDSLADANFLITGATGLIGSSLVHCLLSLNKNISITCPIRNKAKASSTFCEESKSLNLIECDLLDFLKGLDDDNNFDYIIHCASPTAGKFMTEHPVETYELAIESTKAILKFAKRTNVKGIVYISSLEQYGQILDERLVSEDIQGYIDCTDSRSSYPLGKRAAEYMCSAYAHEYGINVKIARLTQTFGAGVAADDNRVFAQFARSIINGKDIVLHTTGESAKPYCYTTDCVSAILYILLRGTNGDAYNVANESTYISIKDMAMFLRVNFNPAIHVVVEPHPEMGYAPTTKLKLSASKLAGLGWHAKYNLKDMYSRLIAYLSNHDTNS